MNFYNMHQGDFPDDIFGNLSTSDPRLQVLHVQRIEEKPMTYPADMMNHFLGEQIEVLPRFFNAGTSSIMLSRVGTSFSHEWSAFCYKCLQDVSFPFHKRVSQPQKRAEPTSCPGAGRLLAIEVDFCHCAAIGKRCCHESHHGRYQSLPLLKFAPAYQTPKVEVHHHGDERSREQKHKPAVLECSFHWERMTGRAEIVEAIA
jgi:hypothetical protein